MYINKNMTKWSNYPNFIDDSTPMYRSEYNKILIQSKELCSTDDADFDIPQDRAVFEKNIRWPEGSVILVKFLDGQEWQHKWIEKTVVEQIVPLISPKLSIKFVDRTSTADVKITLNFSGYGASLLGTKCKLVDQYKPTMKFGTIDFPESRKFEYDGKQYTIPDNVDIPINNTGSVIKHEFGHVFGKWHEHQNPIDNPIKWDVNKVLKYYIEPPEPWQKKDIYNNILNKMDIDKSIATPFDPSSIMMYTVLPELTTNNIGFTKNENYSPLDIEWIQTYSSYVPEKSSSKTLQWILIILFIIVLSGVIIYIILKKRDN